jgi:glycosyltransferase involved in cell wall biosynthesis
MRRLDLGIASYGNSAKLRATLDSIIRYSITDWRCFVIDNPGPDPATRPLIEEYAGRDKRFVFVPCVENMGYAGAVNELLDSDLADTEYVAYCDNDIEIQTPAWDEKLCQILDSAPECAQVFPGKGHYGFFNGRYNECLWNAGYCWALRKSAAELVSTRLLGSQETLQEGVMDEELGHHEEVDLMIRLRLAGFTIACAPDVTVLHHESATSSPESAKRIHAGVVRWMNKWNRYFNGDVLKYPNPDPDSGEGYDPRATRYTDWPPCALYLERMTLALFPQWNASPRTVNVPGVGEMDAVEILKPKGCYVGRAI